MVLPPLPETPDPVRVFDPNVGDYEYYSSSDTYTQVAWLIKNVVPNNYYSSLQGNSTQIPLNPFYYGALSYVRDKSFTSLTDATGYSSYVANIFLRTSPAGTAYLPNASGINYYGFNSNSAYKPVVPELWAFVSPPARTAWLNAVTQVGTGNHDLSTIDNQTTKIVVANGDSVSFTNGAAFSGTICVSSGTLVATDLSQARVMMTDYLTPSDTSRRTLSPYGDEIGTLKVKGLQLGNGVTLEMTLGGNNQSDTIQLLTNDFLYTGPVRNLMGVYYLPYSLPALPHFNFVENDNFAAGIFTVIKGLQAPVDPRSFSYSGNFAGIDHTELYMVGDELRFAALQVSELSRTVGYYNVEYWGVQSDNPSWAFQTEAGTRGKAWLQGRDVVFDSTPVEATVRDFVQDGDVEIGDLAYRNGTVGTTLRITNDQSPRSLTFVQEESEISVNAGLTLHIDSVVSGTGIIHKVGDGKLILAGENTYTGATIISSGVVQIGIGGTTGRILGDIENNTTLEINRRATVELPGDINGSGRLVQTGSGVLTLSGSNSYAGATSIIAGLNINSSTALGSGAVIIGGKFPILDNTSGTAVRLTQSNTQQWNANFTFQGSNDLDMGAGAVTINAARTVTVNSATFSVGGAISAAKKNLGLTKKGNGTMVLAGSNTYTGATTITSGTLQLGNGGSTGSVAGKIVNNSALVLDRADYHTFSNVVSGKGSVSYNSGGTTIVTGANSYSGATTLNDGRLESGNTRALGRGDLILNGGTLATADGQNILTAGRDLLWDGNAHIALTLTDDRYSEKLVVKRNLVLLGDAPLTFDFTPTFLPAETHSFLVMTVARGFGDLTADDFAFTSDGAFTGAFRIERNKLYFDGVSTQTMAFSGPSFSSGLIAETSPGAVPEPSTAALILSGLTALLASRRRKVA